jgi:hypothetical protein
MRKGQLYDLILTRKPKDKTFKTDHLLNAYGHTVVRLPPYMCDLIPIEGKKLCSREQRDRRSVTEAAARLNNRRDCYCDWEGYCQHVEQLEQQYWERDGLVADVIDAIFIVNPNESSDDEETSSEDDDESEEATDLSDSDLTRAQ